jgi:hypothetical protein
MNRLGINGVIGAFGLVVLGTLLSLSNEHLKSLIANGYMTSNYSKE